MSIKQTGFPIHLESDDKHHRLQRFVFREGIRIEEESDDKKPKISRGSLLTKSASLSFTNFPNLVFNAFYQEKLGEKEKSTIRYRKCSIIYYLEDDEMKIYEPLQKNSGLPQGCIVKKGKFKKPDGGYYSIDDLNIGNTLFVNGREYTLINCDKFTRNFLTELGFRIKSPLPDVIDPVTLDRNEMNSPRSYRKPIKKDYKLARFFKNHPRQLRFYGTYGSDKKVFQEEKDIILYYDLSNGQIKLVEKKSEEDGSIDNCTILRPTLIPKRMIPPFIGEMGDPTLLNTTHDIQPALVGGLDNEIQNPASGLVDSNPIDGQKKIIDYYTDADLELGKILDIFGSPVTLYDCDEFTKSYYLENYSKELVPISRPAIKPDHTHMLVLKHEGIGEPEDSLRTHCLFNSKTNNVDLLKFFKHDRCGYNVGELKFLSRVLSDDPVEKPQRFIVCWFLEDDTMSISCLDLESKPVGSKRKIYFKRMKITKPHSVYENAGRCFYQPIDMYVGNFIYVRGKTFELLEADEYTYDYMEKHCDLFSVSNVRLIMTNLREFLPAKSGALKARFEEVDPHETGYVSYESFRDILLEEIPTDEKYQYPEHVIKTLARFYAEDTYIGLKVEELVSKVQTELYRRNYDDFKDLALAFAKHDIDKTSYMDTERTYYVLRTVSLPIDRDLLKSLIYMFPKENNKINYMNLINAMDWVTNPATYDHEAAHPIQINWQRIETEKDLNKIDYNCFMTELLLS